MPIEDIISIETQIEKVETRLGDQMNSGVEVFDVKVDLMQLMNQQIHIERNEKKAQLTHKFHFEDIEEQDSHRIAQLKDVDTFLYSWIFG